MAALTFPAAMGGGSQTFLLTSRKGRRRRSGSGLFRSCRAICLLGNPELGERHPEWLAGHQPGGRSRPELEEIAEEQKAFMNTLKPGGRRSQTSAGAKPIRSSAEDQGYRPCPGQFCVCQEGFLNGELDLIRALAAQ